MFGIELELNALRKLELGVVGFILLLAGFFVIQNWAFWSGNHVDTTITSWIEDHQFPSNPNQPVSADNPYNPKNTQLITVFAKHDGKLEFVEYPNDPDRGTVIRFLADTRGANVTRSRAQWATLSNVSDYVHRILVINGRSTLDRHIAPALPILITLTAAQRKAELAARKTLQDNIFLIDDGMNGAFDHTFYQKVLAALNDYRKNNADLNTDATKKRLASRVMDLGLQYLDRADKARLAVLLKYAKAVDQTLTDDQRQTLQEEADRLADDTPAAARTM